MKKTHPKILAERQRLLNRLLEYEELLRDDVESIKDMMRPLQMAKTVVHEAADAFRDNSLATQGTRLALTMLPGRARNPLVGIAAQIAVPMLMRNLPGIVNFVSEKAGNFRETALGERIGNLWDRLRGR